MHTYLSVSIVFIYFECDVEFYVFCIKNFQILQFNLIFSNLLIRRLESSVRCQNRLGKGKTKGFIQIVGICPGPW